MPIPRDPPRRRSTHLLSVEPPLGEELFGPGTPEGFGAVDAPVGELKMVPFGMGRAVRVEPDVVVIGVLNGMMSSSAACCAVGC